jgi:hypothetical protein
MMKRYMVVTAGLSLVLAVLALGGAVPAVAQGPLKPIEALIINDTSDPVPVTVVPPAPETEVVCSWQTQTVQGTTFLSQGTGVLGETKECPTGVTAVDVRRVVFAAFGEHVASYRITLGVADPPASSPRTVAYLTDGAPEAAPIGPLVLDMTNPPEILLRFDATSGIPGVDLSLVGKLLVIGTPVQ